MNKIWARYRLIPSILIAIIVTCLLGLLLNNGVYLLRDAYNTQSIYTNTEIDFIVPSPSKEQCADLGDLNHIDKVTPYYATKTNVEYEGRSISENIILFDSFDILNCTPYSSTRCINRESDLTGKVLIDYEFYKISGLNLGQNLNIAIGSYSSIFKIGGIFETNSFFDKGAIALVMSPEMKTTIDASRDTPLPYSAAYIKSNNLEMTKNYLKTDYKPLGILKGREAFDTDEAYEIYLNGFYSANYFNEITVTSNLENDAAFKANNYINNGKTMIIISFVVAGLLPLLYEFIFSRIKTVKNRIHSLIKKGEAKNNIRKFYLSNYIIQFILCVCIFCGISALFVFNSASYFNFNTWVIWYIIGFSTLIVSNILALLIASAGVKSCFKTMELKNEGKY